MQRIRMYPNTFCPCKTNARRKVIPVKASNASPPITISMMEYILMRVTGQDPYYKAKKMEE